MKKVYCIFPFMYMLQSVFCAEEATQPKVSIFQEAFIQRFQSDQNESVFPQNGELIISVSENEASIATNSSFKIHEKTEVALPISIKLGVGNNAWTWPVKDFETFYGALQYIEFSLGKGSVTYTTEKGKALTLAKLDSLLFRIDKVKDSEHSSQFSLYTSIKNLSFPDLTPGNITALFGNKAEDFTLGARILVLYGDINSEVKGSFTLPNGKEFVALRQMPPESPIEVFKKIMAYGWGFEFASTSSNAMLSDKSRFLFKPESGKMDLLYQSDFIQAADFVEKVPDFVLDILQIQASRYPIEQLKKVAIYASQHRKEWDALFENSAPSNNGSILFDLKAKTNESISSGKLDFLFKFAKEKTDFLFKIDGTLLNDNLPEVRSTRGKMTISLNNYAKVFDDALEEQNRLSRFRQGFDPSYQPVDGAPYVAYMKEWVKFLDPKAAAGDKNMSILFDYSNPDNPKIGSRTLAEIQNGPKLPQ